MNLVVHSAGIQMPTLSRSDVCFRGAVSTGLTFVSIWGRVCLYASNGVLGDDLEVRQAVSPTDRAPLCLTTDAVAESEDCRPRRSVVERSRPGHEVSTHCSADALQPVYIAAPAQARAARSAGRINAKQPVQLQEYGSGWARQRVGHDAAIKEKIRGKGPALVVGESETRNLPRSLCRSRVLGAMFSSFICG